LISWSHKMRSPPLSPIFFAFVFPFFASVQVRLDFPPPGPPGFPAARSTRKHLQRPISAPSPSAPSSSSLVPGPHMPFPRCVLRWLLRWLLLLLPGPCPHVPFPRRVLRWLQERPARSCQCQVRPDFPPPEQERQDAARSPRISRRQIYAEAPPAPHFSTNSVGSVLLLPGPWSARALSPLRSPLASPLASPFCLRCLQLDVRCIKIHQGKSRHPGPCSMLVLVLMPPPAY